MRKTRYIRLLDLLTQDNVKNYFNMKFHDFVFTIAVLSLDYSVQQLNSNLNPSRLCYTPSKTPGIEISAWDFLKFGKKAVANTKIRVQMPCPQIIQVNFL